MLYINPRPAARSGWGKETGTKRVSLKPNPSSRSPSEAAGRGGKRLGAQQPRVPAPAPAAGGPQAAASPRRGIQFFSLLRPPSV